MFKIATWNVNSLRVRLPHVEQWLETNQVDVLALQETKIKDENFPLDEIKALGYEAVYSGQPTYNGVAILSRKAAKNVFTGLPGFEDPQKRVIGADINDTSILNLYVPNGSSVGSEKYAYKLEWLSHLLKLVKRLLKKKKRLLLLGDFNIAPEDRDVHDPAEWEGSVHVSPAERAEFQHLLDTGLKDAFRLFPQPENSYSWWDYRAAAFRRDRGLRIDHILVNPALASLCKSCHIDKEPRKLERPSDHAPVVAEFSLTG
jgi:exodeoxyribonuclease-3